MLLHKTAIFTVIIAVLHFACSNIVMKNGDISNQVKPTKATSNSKRYTRFMITEKLVQHLDESCKPLPDHTQVMVKHPNNKTVFCMPCTSCPAGQQVEPLCRQEFLFEVLPENLYIFQECRDCVRGRYKSDSGIHWCKQCRNPCGNKLETKSCSPFHNRDCSKECKPDFYGRDCDKACCFCGNSTSYTMIEESQCKKHPNNGGKRCARPNHIDIDETVCPAPVVNPKDKDVIKTASNKSVYISVSAVAIIAIISGIITKVLLGNRCRKPGNVVIDMDGVEANLLEDAMPVVDLHLLESVESNHGSTLLSEMINRYPLLFDEYLPRIAEQTLEDGRDACDRIAEHFKIEQNRFGLFEQRRRVKTKFTVLVDLFQKEEEDMLFSVFLQVLSKQSHDEMLQRTCEYLHQHHLTQQLLNQQHLHLTPTSPATGQVAVPAIVVDGAQDADKDQVVNNTAVPSTSASLAGNNDRQSNQFPNDEPTIEAANATFTALCLKGSQHTAAVVYRKISSSYKRMSQQFEGISEVYPSSSCNKKQSPLGSRHAPNNLGTSSIASEGLTRKKSSTSPLEGGQLPRNRSFSGDDQVRRLSVVDDREHTVGIDARLCCSLNTHINIPTTSSRLKHLAVPCKIGSPKTEHSDEKDVSIQMKVPLISADQSSQIDEHDPEVQDVFKIEIL